MKCDDFDPVVDPKSFNSSYKLGIMVNSNLTIHFGGHYKVYDTCLSAAMSLLDIVYSQ